MKEHISNIRELINRRAASLPLDREPSGLYKPIAYEFSLGGKRLRPILACLSYELYGENIEDIMPAALGLETYHNFTLLHDDLMDRSDIRRGKPTVNVVWDDNTAILSGDAMTMIACRLALGSPATSLREVMDIFTQTALEICEGQQYDMDFENREDVTAEEYIEMIRLKTSVLLAASLKIGAVVGGASAEEAEKLYQFGIKSGLAFQLQDDWLDTYGDTAIFGKNTGDDIADNKKTYMLITALERAEGKTRDELLKWINAKEFDREEKVGAVKRIYDETGAGKACLDMIDKYYEEGLKILRSVKADEDKKKPLEYYIKQLKIRDL